MLFELSHGIMRAIDVEDAPIPLEHRRALPARNVLNRVLRDPRSREVLRCRSPQIVEEQAAIPEIIGMHVALAFFAVVAGPFALATARDLASARVNHCRAKAVDGYSSSDADAVPDFAERLHLASIIPREDRIVGLLPNAELPE